MTARACLHDDHRRPAYSTGHTTFPSGVPLARGEEMHYCPSCMSHFSARPERRRLDPVEMGELLRARRGGRS